MMDKPTQDIVIFMLDMLGQKHMPMTLWIIGASGVQHIKIFTRLW